MSELQSGRARPPRSLDKTRSPAVEQRPQKRHTEFLELSVSLGEVGSEGKERGPEGEVPYARLFVQPLAFLDPSRGA